MARRGTPLAKKVARARPFGRHGSTNGFWCVRAPRELFLGWQDIHKGYCRLVSLREAIEVGYYSDIVAIKRGAFLCSDTRQIARSNYRLLDIKRRIRWPVRSAKAINGSRISQAGSDNWIERFFSSLHKRSSTLFLSIPSRDPATCYFDPLLDLFARIYSFLPSP